MQYRKVIDWLTSTHEKTNAFFAKEKAVIMTGKMVSLKVLKNNILALNPIGLWWKTWFYKHVETYLEKGSLTGIRDEDVPSEYVELIPLRDYFHRHTRSIFWVIFNPETLEPETLEPLSLPFSIEPLP